MHRILSPITLCVLVAACATTARYEAILQAWVGASERELVEVWGPPDSVFELEETRFLTYRFNEAVLLPDRSPTFRTIDDDFVATDTLGYRNPTLISRSCKTSFTIVDSTVTGWRAEGNACQA